MNINVTCSLSNTGYGIASKYILKQLDQFGHHISVISKGGYEADSHEDKTLFDKWISNGKLFPHDGTHLNIWHQFDLGQTFGRGKKYAFPFFELNRFSDLEKHHLKYPDELIVSSKWAAGIVKEQTDRESHVVPLGVDNEIFSPAPQEKSRTTYKFINAGKWEVRKGHDVLVEIFNKAFTKKDDVELILIPFNPFLNSQETIYWETKYKHSKLGNKISIVPHNNYTHFDIASIIRQCDCGIFPSRAEGWNLELLECMACGLPVVTTNYSAHTEFCNSFNSYLIEPKGLEEAYDGKWFFKQGDWAKLTDDSIDEFVHIMRHLYEKRPYNIEGIETGQKFSWKNSAAKLLQVLEK